MNPITSITRWYFSKKALPYWYVFGLDCVIVLVCNALTFLMLSVVAVPRAEFDRLSLTLGAYLLCYMAGFRAFRTYSGVIRYSSFVDLQRVGYASALGMALIYLVRLTDVEGVLLPIRGKYILVAGMISVAAMWAIRVMVKYLYDSTFAREKADRIFIYGVKKGGVSLAKSIRNQDPPAYTLAGFVSDEAENFNRMLLGVRVYPNDEQLVETMRRKRASILFVSPMKSDDLRANGDMVNRLTEAGIKIFVVPEAHEWDGKSELSHTQLREVEIEDLLPRDKIEIDLEGVGRKLRGSVVMITGAAGSIGSEIVRQAAVFGPKSLVLIDQAETPLHDLRLEMARQWPAQEALTIVADICNARRMEELFARHRPAYVFHAAAYKHVPMMEDNPGESVRNNIEGTRIVADLAVKYGAAKFVMVSTDKAVNPTNVMGCSKRICEIYVQSLDKAIKDGRVGGRTQFVTTRFGNVLGSNGSVIPLFREQIKRGGPVTVTHKDIIRYFMLIPEACKLVLEAGTMGNGGEIFVFDMGAPVRIVDLARRMINLSGAKDVEIKFTGLRDGEKLYEEVLSEAEKTKPTFHPKIKIADVREYDYGEASEAIEALVARCQQGDDMETVRLMKAMVPEYKSQHSVYEKLDK